MAGEVYLKSHREIAEACGVSVNTVKQSWVGNGMPGKSGRYPIFQIFRWALARAQSANKVEGHADIKLAKLKAEAFKVQQDAKNAELNYKKNAGELVPVEAVEELLDVQITTHNSQLEQLADRILRVIPSNTSKQIKRAILKECHQVGDDLRNTIADAVEAWERGDYDLSDEDEAATAD